MSIRILMIEDDSEIAELLQKYLKRFDMFLENYEEPYDALDVLEQKTFDIVILDLTLPDIDGLELCKIISEKHHLPIIISSARSDVKDRVIGLEMGADDYLSKPYNPRELVARINSVLRRFELKSRRSSDSDSEFDIDESKMEISKNGKTLPLTVAEYEILRLFINNRGRIVSREFILNNAQSLSVDSIDRSIDVIISRIRKKIGDDSRKPSYIKTVKGAGYKFL